MKQVRRQPVVGIDVSIDRGARLRPGADYYYVRRAYAESIRTVGGVPLLLTLDTPPEKVATICDAVVLSGGDNLPRSWSEAGATQLARPEDPERIAWDRQLLDSAQRYALPVLGICYGMQLVNLHFGGSLYSDLTLELPAALDHGGGTEVTRHELELLCDSRLFLGLPRRLLVNSCHGQAVNVVAPGFRVTARAEDGVVEAIEGKGFYGVEWHPETDPASARLFENFLELVRACISSG